MSSYVNTNESRGVGAIASTELISRPRPGYAGAPKVIGGEGEIIRPVKHTQVATFQTPRGMRKVALKSRPAVYPSAGYMRSMGAVAPPDPWQTLHRGAKQTHFGDKYRKAADPTPPMPPMVNGADRGFMGTGIPTMYVLLGGGAALAFFLLRRRG